MKDNSIWSHNFRISSYQVDRKGNLTLYALAGIFQEAAREHSRLLKFGYEDMIKYDWIWVLYRLKTRIFKIPHWEENILLQSWMVRRTRFVSRRDFEIFREGGERVVAAVSEWALVDVNTKKPVLLDKIDEGRAPFIPKKMALEKAPDRIPPVKNTISQSNYTVRYSDIDMNDHMNNMQYLRIILDSYSWEWLNSHSAEIINVNFKTESKINDELVINTSAEKDIFVHQVIRKRDKATVTLLKVKWIEEAPS